MSGLSKRRYRFFTIMGASIILSAFYMLTLIPWEEIGRIDQNLYSFFLFNFFVWVSIGMTEIAVAWLLAKHIE